jgi:LMBR1 domain-containing protein 1
MADIFLIVVMVVAVVLLMIMSLYLLVYYSHPDDKNDAYVPKFVVMAGFVLAGATVLLFPLDVANKQGYAGCAGYDTALCGGLPMVLLWQIVFWAIPIFVWILVPFMTFYYEADDGMLMAGTAYQPNPKKKSRIASACCYQMFVILIVGAIFAVLYVVFNETKIPVVQYEPTDVSSALNMPIYTIPAIDTTTGTNVTFQTGWMRNMNQDDVDWVDGLESQKETMQLQVSVATFFGGLMAWIGTNYFIFCTG